MSRMLHLNTEYGVRLIPAGSVRFVKLNDAGQVVVIAGEEEFVILDSTINTFSAAWSAANNDMIGYSVPTKHEKEW